MCPTKPAQNTNVDHAGLGPSYSEQQAPERTVRENSPTPDYEMVYTTEPQSEYVTKSDIIIAVMGPTGSGKSSFINHIVGEERTQVGHKLVSCTYKIDIIRYRTHDDSQVVLIDTPGFNDTNLTDYAILVMITDWLAATYKQEITLSGVLYFHRITDNRMTGTLQHNLDMFKSIVGVKAFSNIALVTTMWDAVADNMAIANEQQLRAFYWRDIIQKGGRIRRHDDTRQSALKIISEFSASPHPTLLLVQHEMVDLNKPLPETTVGRRFVEWLSELLDRVKRRVFKQLFTKRSPAQVRKDTDLVMDIEKLDMKRRWIVNLRGATTPSPAYTASPRSSITLDVGDSPPSPVLPLPQCSSISSYSGHDVLQTTILWLKHASALSTLGPVPGLRELINIALVVAQAVDKFWSSEDSLVLLSQNTSWFASAIIHHASNHKLSDELVSSIASFNRDLERVQLLIQEALKQPAAKRYMLSDKEKQLIETCNQGILNSTQLLQIRIALHNHQYMQVMNERVLSILHTGFEDIQQQFNDLNRRITERRCSDTYSSIKVYPRTISPLFNANDCQLPVSHILFVFREARRKYASTDARAMLSALNVPRTS